MTSPWERNERHWADVVSAQLRENGYEVELDPGRSQLPFNLAGYHPDLIATRDDGGLIIEIKTDEKRLSIDRYVEVAALVRQHPGWRFVLIPTERLGEASLSALLALPSRTELARRGNDAALLLESRLYAPAFLTAWTAVEGYLRLLAEENAVPVSSLSIIPLVKHLYSQGLLSIEQFNILQLLIPTRNRVVHGLEDPNLADTAPQVIRLFASLLSGNLTS